MSNTTTTYESWIGSDVHDRSGERIGTIDQIHLDDRSGEPEWLTVSTGWFGTSTRFIPIAGSTAHGSGLQVPYTVDHVKKAPTADADGCEPGGFGDPFRGTTLR